MVPAGAPAAGGVVGATGTKPVGFFAGGANEEGRGRGVIGAEPAGLVSAGVVAGEGVKGEFANGTRPVGGLLTGAAPGDNPGGGGGVIVPVGGLLLETKLGSTAVLLGEDGGTVGTEPVGGFKETGAIKGAGVTEMGRSGMADGVGAGGATGAGGGTTGAALATGVGAGEVTGAGIAATGAALTGAGGLGTKGIETVEGGVNGAALTGGLGVDETVGGGGTTDGAALTGAGGRGTDGGIAGAGVAVTGAAVTGRGGTTDGAEAMGAGGRGTDGGIAGAGCGCNRSGNDWWRALWKARQQLARAAEAPTEELQVRAWPQRERQRLAAAPRRERQQLARVAEAPTEEPQAQAWSQPEWQRLAAAPRKARRQLARVAWVSKEESPAQAWPPPEWQRLAAEAPRREPRQLARAAWGSREMQVPQRAREPEARLEQAAVARQGLPLCGNDGQRRRLRGRNRRRRHLGHGSGYRRGSRFKGMCHRLRHSRGGRNIDQPDRSRRPFRPNRRRRSTGRRRYALLGLSAFRRRRGSANRRLRRHRNGSAGDRRRLIGRNRGDGQRFRLAHGGQRLRGGQRGWLRAMRDRFQIRRDFNLAALGRKPWPAGWPR